MARSQDGDALGGTAFTIVKGVGYVLGVPAQGDSGRERPLLVSLHGTEETPADAFRCWAGAAAGANCFLLCPAPRSGNWDVLIDIPRISRLIRSLLEQHPIAKDRIYLTGFSSGATVACILGLRSLAPSFRGLVLASGHYAGLVESLGTIRPDVYVHIVHGRKDKVFPASSARRHAQMLRQRGLTVAYTEMKDLGHDYPPEETVLQLMRWLTETPLHVTSK